MTTLTASKPRVLQNGRLLPSLETRLASAFDLHRLPDEADRKTFLADNGSAFVGLVTSSGPGASSELIEALPALRVISSFGVGLDQVDLVAAARRNIAVGHTPDVLNDCVADLAMGLMVDVARGMSAADRFVRADHWMHERFALGRRVSGKRLGIVGFGRIGRCIARRSTGFDMQVRYHNRKPVQGAAFPYEPSLKALATWCDFLVIAVSGDGSTKHLIDQHVLEALGPDGFLINVSRGTVVHESALVDCLVKGRIAGAGLDVFEAEPRVPEELKNLSNVVLLPHIGTGTIETRGAMADLTFDNLEAFFARGEVLAAAPMVDSERVGPK